MQILFSDYDILSLFYQIIYLKCNKIRTIQSHSVFCFSQHFGHGRELELAPTGRGFREKGEIIGELNGSANHSVLIWIFLTELVFYALRVSITNNGTLRITNCCFAITNYGSFLTKTYEKG